MNYIDRNREFIEQAEGKASINLLPIEQLHSAVHEARAACKAHGVPAKGLEIEVTCAGADTGTSRYPKQATYARVHIMPRSYTVVRVWRAIARKPKQHWRFVGAEYSAKSTNERLASLRKLAKAA